MTDLQLINYYANLLILQYRQKPNAFATIQDLVEPVIMAQVPAQVNLAFDPATAAGQQLDFVGKYVGAKRVGYDLQNNPVTLNDADYRTLVLSLILLNQNNGSLKAIQDLLAAEFPGVIQVFENENMHLSYFYEAALGANVAAEFFVKQKYLPKPMACGEASVILAPIAEHYLGFRTYDIPAFQSTPLNDYASGFVEGPTLSYTQAIQL